MFNTIKNYIIGVLLIMSVTFGYASYSLYGDKVVVEAELFRITSELKIATQNVSDAQLSCKVGQDITKDVNTSIKTQMDRTQQRVEALIALPATTPQETKHDSSKATTGAPSTYADGGRLSPSLMRLLDAAYCDSNKDDSACTAK